MGVVINAKLQFTSGVSDYKMLKADLTRNPGTSICKFTATAETGAVELKLV